ncbi:MAG: hypothetical protein B7Z55_10885 [Planctomycetales bacterium 12-60-4]|nr:MAG: hypothetical protein B7Z55_10885 [Planctomycetales bacterium 12-60-4]
MSPDSDHSAPHNDRERRIRELARLWTAAQPTVSAYIASLVYDFRDRDDVLQDVAVAVVDHFEAYDPTRPFLAWALGVARNQVKMYCRTRGRDRHVFDSAAMEAVAEAMAESPQTSVQIARYLADCYAHLDDRARKLCELRYAHGLKPAAIAAAGKQTANTVAKSLQRIREQLRDCIERKTVAGEG